MEFTPSNISEIAQSQTASSTFLDPSNSALKSVRSALTGNKNTSSNNSQTASMRRRQQERAQAAQEAWQLKQQARQLSNDWQNNSAVISETTHGGTETTLLHQLIKQVQMEQKRAAQTRAQAPSGTTKGPQMNQNQRSTSMFDRMQPTHDSQKPKDSEPALHELPLGE